ncbi:MAG: hypothetical protein WAU36_17980 [Cyclobacteriaceae bacterium]
MRKTKKLKIKSSKMSHSEPGRARFLKNMVDRIILAVQELDNPEEEYPKEKLLEELNILRGFVEDMKFPEDRELEEKKISLARPEAGRKRGALKRKTMKSICLEFLNISKAQYYTIYQDWFEKKNKKSGEDYPMNLLCADPKYFDKIKRDFNSIKIS